MTKQVDLAGFTSKIAQVQQAYQRSYDHAGQYFRKITPYRSGNAYRNTSHKDNVITANYAYAERLDAGWSPMARNGMSQPTIDEFDRYLKKELRKIK